MATSSGKKAWKKEHIEKKEIAIADLGCGIGITPLLLVHDTVHYYIKNNWQFAHPVQFDLVDIIPGHQKALEILSKIINDAYPQFFRFISSIFLFQIFPF